MTAVVLDNSFDIKEFFQSTKGVSKEADLISVVTKKIFDHINDSISNVKQNNPIFDQLIKIQQECSIDEWDGYDARKVEAQTINNVYGFINLLDDNLPIPSLCPEPDGEVAVEWFGDNGSTISISVGLTDIISYAAIFPDKNKANGTDFLKNEDKGIIEKFIKKVICTT